MGVGYDCVFYCQVMEMIEQPTQCIDFLNAEFAHRKLKFSQVAAGLLKAELSFGEKSSAQLHLQGAHVSHWQDSLGRENLFTSNQAVYQKGVAIRGGNPIIFPQFGPGVLAQHGFARHSVWQVLETRATETETAIVLQLKPENIAEQYRLQWPHDFLLKLTVSLCESLITRFEVQNTHSTPFEFTHGFHTYLAVDDINRVEISGLSGLQYMDNLRGKTLFDESRKRVSIDEFTDRRYQDIPETLEIKDRSSGRCLRMVNRNCRDAFVWNPWQEAEKGFSDLAPGSYRQYICVEPGNMQKAVVLPAGQSFVAVQEIQRLDG